MGNNLLNQIESLLEGDGRFKLFDSSRLEILIALGGNELKILILHWAYEQRGQESWLSLSTIRKLTRLSDKTIISAHKNMEKLGWLVWTGQMAAEKYTKPTRGANQIKVYRVDDPTDRSGKELLPHSELLENLQHPKIPVNVSVSNRVVSGSCSTPLVSDSDMEVCKLASQGTSSLRSGETKTKKTASAVKWMETYTESMPDGFNSWSQLSKAVWVEEHKRRVLDDEDELDELDASVSSWSTSATADTTPSHAASPAHRCPLCEFGHKYGYRVAEHIEESHLEQGQQSFRIQCVADGGHWG